MNYSLFPLLRSVQLPFHSVLASESSRLDIERAAATAEKFKRQERFSHCSVTPRILTMYKFYLLRQFAFIRRLLFAPFKTDIVARSVQRFLSLAQRRGEYRTALTRKHTHTASVHFYRQRCLHRNSFFNSSSTIKPPARVPASPPTSSERRPPWMPSTERSMKSGECASTKNAEAKEFYCKIISIHGK